MDHNIIENILSFLSPQEVVKCETVCKEWKEIARRKSLWRIILKNWQEYEKSRENEYIYDAFELINDKEYYTYDDEYEDIERFVTLALSHPTVVNDENAGVHIAVRKGNFMAYKVCADMIDDAYPIDKFGRNPIEVACVYNQYNMAEYLWELPT